MTDNANKKILDRDKAINFGAKISEPLDSLRDFVDYGTDLILRCYYYGSNKSLKDVVALFSLFKNALSMADAIEVMMRQGVIRPSQLQLRSLFEVSVTLQWILQEPGDERARAYHVANLRRQRLDARRDLPGTVENKAFKDLWDTIGERTPSPAREKELRAQIANLNKELSGPSMRDLNKKFEDFYRSLNSTRKCNRLSRWHRNGQLVYFPWPFQTPHSTEALMGTYHQLTEHQRYQIYALKKVGHDQQCIAATVGVSPSTICRELRRNRGQRGYRPHQAHQQALARRRAKAKATKMTPAVIERIEADLRQEWSPEQIAGRLAADDSLRLSPERIYQHIRADRQAGGTLYRHLRHSQKKRKKRYGKADGRGQIKDRVSIDQRPAIVDEKSRIGDWEIDLVMGRPGTGALVSLVERRSRYTLLGNVGSKQAEPVAATTIGLLAPHKEHTQTITADNGKEFADHATISQALDAAVYFAHPYHAWERGLNENTNGLIRQYVPKGTALDTLSQAQIHHIMERLNHRPRKGLAFQTPYEILSKETAGQPEHFKIALTS